MCFQITRRAANDRPVKMSGKVTRCPARFRTTAPALFERQEEFVTQAGIVRIDHDVPLFRVNVMHRAVCCDADPDRFIIGV